MLRQLPSYCEFTTVVHGMRDMMFFIPSSLTSFPFHPLAGTADADLPNRRSLIDLFLFYPLIPSSPPFLRPYSVHAPQLPPSMQGSSFLNTRSISPSLRSPSPSSSPSFPLFLFLLLSSASLHPFLPKHHSPHHPTLPTPRLSTFPGQVLDYALSVIQAGSPFSGSYPVGVRCDL